MSGASAFGVPWNPHAASAAGGAGRGGAGAYGGGSGSGSGGRGGGNPLVAGEHDLSGPLSGTRLLDSAAELREALESGSWVMGAMAGVGLAADTVAAVTDPLGEAIAAGVGWAIEHLGSLKEWLQELTGNPGQVSAASETWGSVASHLEECAGMITTSITSRLGAQHSMAVDVL